jgi:hypothetical protein
MITKGYMENGRFPPVLARRLLLDKGKFEEFRLIVSQVYS